MPTPAADSTTDSTSGRSGESVLRDDAEVRVLLFSTLREAVGTTELALSMPAGARVAELLDELASRYDAVALHRPVIRVAVNAVYTSEEERLSAGDEVALITPVSGG